MIATLPPYPEYRDSGVEWLAGELDRRGAPDFRRKGIADSGAHHLPRPPIPISPRNCDARFSYPKYVLDRVSVNVSRALVIATKQLLRSSSTSRLVGPFLRAWNDGNTSWAIPIR